MSPPLSIHTVLKKYWGFDAFRPLQEDIINSVLKRNDTLALMPTGGGKSLCYQVPAMAQDGLCIVVSPLIALMQDQVQALQKKNIKAVAVTSAMNFREIETTFNNAVYNSYKFLYVSPERIQTPLFLRKLSALNVSLIAVDEAHCISQWGYDFRPAYLNIKKIREIKPDVPLLALTATATKRTVNDIIAQLEFKENKKIFRTSFARKNLHYFIRKEENKLPVLLNICTKNKGSGIVYVRNRRKTKEIADYLVKNGVKSDYYHAGLDTSDRVKKQNDWLANRSRVIVSTNAFGMGIDKSDVRFVSHMDLPDSLEAWFQEAGRGGRDGKTAYALTLYNEADILGLREQLELAFPSLEEIKKVYAAVCNYYQVAVGAGEGLSVNFNLDEISERYKLLPATIYNSIKFLEKENILSYSDGTYQQARVHITAGKEELYNFQVQNPLLDTFIKALLRTYAGLFEEYIAINEYKLARAAKTDVDGVRKTMEKLHRLQILDFIPANGLPKLVFVQARVDSKFLHISKEHYAVLKKQAEERLKAVIDFVTDENTCRSRKILQYFDETEFEDCGQCDVCLRKKKKDKAPEMQQISGQLLNLLEHKNYRLDELVSLLYHYKKEEVVDCINTLTDDKKLDMDKNKMVSKI